MVNGEALATQVNDVLAARPPCRATLMKSCVSADLSMTNGQATRETSPIARLSQ
jgi:hypothetical protein